MTSSYIRKLAAVAFTLSILLVAYLGFVITNGDTDTQKGIVKKSDTLFRNISFSMRDADDNTVQVTASSIVKNRESLECDNIIADVLYNGQKANVQAKKMIVQQSFCKLLSNVKAFLQNNIQLRTNYVEVDIKNKRARSNSGIRVEKKDLIVSAEAYAIDFAKYKAKLTKNASIKFADRHLSSDACYAEFKQVDGKYILHNAILNGNVKYTSNLCNVATKKQVRFSENRVYFAGFVTINGVINRKKFKLESGKANVYLSKSNDIKKLECKNRFVFYLNDNIISGNDAVLDGDVIHAEGNVCIKDKHGVVRSERADYNITSGKLVMRNTGGVIFRKAKSKDARI